MGVGGCVDGSGGGYGCVGGVLCMHACTHMHMHAHTHAHAC